MNGPQEFTLRIRVEPSGDVTRGEIAEALLSELDQTIDTETGYTLNLTVLSAQWTGRAR